MATDDPVNLTPIRVLIADDHPTMRDALNFLLESADGIQIVGEAADGEAACRHVDQLKPDVVLMDVSMPKVDGIEATRRIVAKHPGTRVLALLMRHDQLRAKAMREAGSAGCVIKGGDPDALIQTIRAQRQPDSPLPYC